MQSETIARRYATAVFGLAREAGRIGPVGDGLRAASAAIYGADDVRRFYLSPVFGRANKERALAASFGSRVDEIALHSLLLLVRKRREALLRPIVVEFEKLALAESRREPLHVTSARPLGDDELATLVARLGSGTGKQYEVTHDVDASLLGGVRVTIGDRLIDGSLAGRLESLARELAVRG